MRNFTIYLAGGMSGIPMEEYGKRRDKIRNLLTTNKPDNLALHIVDPSKYYNYDYKHHETEKEILRWELNKVRNSNLIIVDLTVEKSVGTIVELAIAYENKIPIVGVNADKENIHPWLEEICDRTFNNIETGIDYVISYYLW